MFAAQDYIIHLILKCPFPETNYWILLIPDPLEGTESFGDLLSWLQLTNLSTLVIGITPKSDEITNPGKPHNVEHGSLLIYMAKTPPI